MTPQVYILVDQEPVPVPLAVWHAWMAEADRVVDYFESHTPHKVWTLTTYFLGLVQDDVEGQPHMFATIYKSGPTSTALVQRGPVRLARTWSHARASHRQVLGMIQTRYSGAG